MISIRAIRVLKNVAVALDRSECFDNVTFVQCHIVEVRKYLEKYASHVTLIKQKEKMICNSNHYFASGPNMPTKP